MYIQHYLYFLSLSTFVYLLFPIHYSLLTLFIHFREFGVHIKEFDLIDEALLSPDQMRVVCSILYDVTLNDIPHPSADWNSFLAVIEPLNSRADLSYSLGKMRMMPPIDMAALKASYGPSYCTIS